MAKPEFPKVFFPNAQDYCVAFPVLRNPIVDILLVIIVDMAPWVELTTHMCNGNNNLKPILYSILDESPNKRWKINGVKTTEYILRLISSLE